MHDLCSQSTNNTPCSKVNVELSTKEIRRVHTKHEATNLGCTIGFYRLYLLSVLAGVAYSNVDMSLLWMYWNSHVSLQTTMGGSFRTQSFGRAISTNALQTVNARVFLTGLKPRQDKPAQCRLKWRVELLIVCAQDRSWSGNLGYPGGSSLT